MSEQGTQQLNRSAMRALLAHYRITAHDTAPEDVITDWLRELRGRSVGECHAALSSMAPNRPARHGGRGRPADRTRAVPAGRHGHTELGQAAAAARPGRRPGGGRARRRQGLRGDGLERAREARTRPFGAVPVLQGAGRSPVQPVDPQPPAPARGPRPEPG